MQLLTAAIASLSFMVSSCAQTDKITLTPRSQALPPMLTLDDVRTVAPALERYTQGALLGDLWKRPDLSSRDRSIITVAALIARNQTIEMPYHFNLALDNGVRPNEISEIITHLAFYSGWANAMSAVAVAKDVFVAQIPYHLNRAMDNGLTQAQAAEAITHLAFYVGWPNVFSALPVAKGVFDNRPK